MSASPWPRSCFSSPTRRRAARAPLEGSPMMTHSRRSLLSAIGLALPFSLGSRVGASATPVGTAPMLRFHPFEEAVREAFADHNRTSPCRRVEVGHSEQVRAGVQGCHNDRPFAGFPTGHLRIVRTGSEPGPVWRGVRLY